MWQPVEDLDEINRSIVKLEQDFLAVLRRRLKPERLIASPAFRHVLDWVDEHPYQAALMTRIKSSHAMTPRHGVNVLLLSRAWMSWGHKLGAMADKLSVAALFHDLGHWRPEDLVYTFGYFSHEEMRRMRKHPLLEGEPAAEDGGPLADPDVRRFIREHHERPDGKGYPAGVRDPHLLSQVLHIVDCFEGLTTERRFRRRYSHFEALKTMGRWAGYHFDAGLFKNFLRFWGEHPFGSFVNLVNKGVAMVLPDPEQGEGLTCLLLTNVDGDALAEPEPMRVGNGDVEGEAPPWREQRLPEGWRTARPDLMGLPRSY
ncbi:HD domain-containing protein [Sulfidibacter corallicola]|uniref:HD domain-containing protein n=1 Tax=Sulfidibacter corallicola TaxID=2818388 RepID=A0A8A4TNF1_SULCO|nr:HD domain-containing phosphohydrolase [Sulfidibacter corallicola]QTD48115.1 HD domain-containing protein [Sulfidibacter corallicola]